MDLGHGTFERIPVSITGSAFHDYALNIAPVIVPRNTTFIPALDQVNLLSQNVVVTVV